MEVISMELFFGIIITIMIIYLIIKNVLKKDKVNEGKGDKISEDEILPYRVKDDFLTDAEYSFYKTLKLSVGEKAIICPKVGLKDIFFIGKQTGNNYMKYFGKIAQKHVDFLLCDPNTMKPILAIELDDARHTSKKSYERDIFIEKLYKDANFKLIRISSMSEYSVADLKDTIDGIINKSQDLPDMQINNETVLCPKCNIPMVLRKATKGQNAGKEFYGCVNYPRCKEVVSKDSEGTEAN